MPFPLIPLLISAIGGLASGLAGRRRVTGVGGVRRFLPSPDVPAAIAIPPIVTGAGKIVSRVAEALITGAGFGAAAGMLDGAPSTTTVGFPQVIDPLTGCPIKKRRRRRGITATELRGFNKVNVLLNKVGKEPRKPRKRVC